MGEATGLAGREAPAPAGGGQRGKPPQGPGGQLEELRGWGLPQGARGGAFPRAVARQGLEPPALGWTEPAPLASVRHLTSLLCPLKFSRRPPPSFPSRFIDCPSASLSLSHTHAHAFTRHKGKGLPRSRGRLWPQPSPQRRGHAAGCCDPAGLDTRCLRRAPNAAATRGGGASFASRKTLPLIHVFFNLSTL